MKGSTRWLILLGVLILAAVFFSAFGERSSSSNKNVSFNFQIRPVLAQNCFSCHGPDPESREANLRLDTEAGAKALLANGQAAIVEGDPDNSSLISRIHSKDPESVMPPPESKKTLTEAEKELLERWIAEGAQWEEFWAFQPPKADQHPDLSTADLIDVEINAELDQRGLQAAPPATADQKLRRISYLLTGLPPTVTEREAYLLDTSQTAYAT
ncbi:MAG: c-type cytochrome domain-containing protein, partial [Bacteroidota bacterium]